MTPSSLPVIPPQPAGPVYGQSDLGLFKQFSRDSYEKAFGVQAPNFDNSKHPKLWFDTSGDPPVYSIIVNGKDGYAYSKMSLTADIASTVNIPGNRHYDAWKPAASGAFQGSPFGNSLVPAKFLATPEQAEQLRVEVGGTEVVEVQDARFPYSYSPNENRRVLNVMVNGIPCNAGGLLAYKYTNGVDAPGKWVVNAGSAPDWIPDVIAQPVEPTMPYVPYPVRLPLPDERLAASPLGSLQVIRGTLPSPTTGGGDFTSDDRRMIKETHERVMAITPAPLG